MTLTLRVLRGARAGITERFDSPVVSIGRHPTSDFRFDPQADLDVSTRHAELRGSQPDGAWTIHDLGSTNGTFVNDERVSGARQLESGDVIGFGPNGPRAEVLLSSSPVATALSPAAPPLRRDTTVRVAEAVDAQMAGVKRTAAIAVVLLTVAAALVIAWTQRQSRQREAALLAVIARIELSSAGLQRAVADMRPRDSAFATLLARRAAETQRSASAGRSAAAAGGGGGGASLAAVSLRLEREAATQQSLSRVDFAHVHDLNEPAVAMLASDLDGTFIAGSAFAVSRSGLLVTNRHMVQTAAGQPARRLRVIFSNTREWLPVHVVRVSAEDDLALVQLDEPASHPQVSAVSRDGAAGGARVGAPVLSIGYPLAVSTPMEGSGLNVTARSTTAAGTVSKRLDDVLQIDSYAGKGSSGSPVFDASGAVVGVIYGGAPESNGRIVYAVPAERLVRFLGGDMSHSPGQLQLQKR